MTPPKKTKTNKHQICIPQKYSFSENPKKYWNSRFWTPINGPSLRIHENIRVPPPHLGHNVGKGNTQTKMLTSDLAGYVSKGVYWRFSVMYTYLMFWHKSTKWESVRDQWYTVKPALSGQSKIDKENVLKTYYRLMQVKSIAECSPLEHSAIFLTYIKR